MLDDLADNARSKRPELEIVVPDKVKWKLRWFSGVSTIFEMYVIPSSSRKLLRSNQILVCLSLGDISPPIASYS